MITMAEIRFYDPLTGRRIEGDIPDTAIARKAPDPQVTALAAILRSLINRLHLAGAPELLRAIDRIPAGRPETCGNPPCKWPLCGCDQS
jgi:hypothetical protein